MYRFSCAPQVLFTMVPRNSDAPTTLAYRELDQPEIYFDKKKCSKLRTPQEEEVALFLAKIENIHRLMGVPQQIGTTAEPGGRYPISLLEYRFICAFMTSTGCSRPWHCARRVFCTCVSSRKAVFCGGGDARASSFKGGAS